MYGFLIWISQRAPDLSFPEHCQKSILSFATSIQILRRQNCFDDQLQGEEMTHSHEICQKIYTAGFSGHNFYTLNFAEFQQLW